MLKRLTRKELREIVGSQVRETQFKWLRDRDWPHESDALGYPIVLTSVAREKLGAPVDPTWTFDESSVA